MILLIQDLIYHHEEHEEHEKMKFDKLSKKVLGCAIKVHRELGPGLMESTYEHCLARELSISNIKFETQVPLPVCYKGIKLRCGYKLDLLIDEQIIIEIKSVERLLSIHESQLLTYMKLSGISIGLLINFNKKLLKNGIRRFVL